MASDDPESCKGTTDQSTPEHIAMLVDWLAWRADTGWAREPLGDAAYDASVRDMAVAAVRIGRRWIRRKEGGE